MLNKKIKPFFKIERIITPPFKSPVKVPVEIVPKIVTKKVKKQPVTASKEKKTEVPRV